MRSKTAWPDILFWICAATIVLAVCGLLSGCFTANNLPKHNDKFPEAAAEYAAKKFPPKETHSIDTVHTSDTVLQEGPAVDTTVYCDTLFVNKPVTVKCPPTKIIHDTVKITATNWMIDGAALEAANLKLQQATSELKATNSKLSWWKIACIITWGIVAVWLSLRIKKF